MSEEVDDAAWANCEVCPQYAHCKTRIRFKCLARTLMENKPRKVTMPPRYNYEEGRIIVGAPRGRWMLADDVIAALKAAVVEVEG